VAVSPATESYLLNTLGMAQDRVSMVLNGVPEPTAPSPEIVEMVRKRFALTSERFVIGCVGRLYDVHKRFSDAIRALPLIRQGGIDACLLLVGEGPDQEMLRDLARSLQVTEHVHFAGYQGDTVPFFDACDLLLHPPAAEAFGLVLTEAMFLRLPVVATAVGGIPSVVVDGETGLLVPPSRPDLIGAAVQSLARDRSARQRMGEAGYQRARDCFGAERYANTIDALYREMLALKNVTAGSR
jgi:glycosyltransferase involved in cell wall biosynthesis